MSTVYRTRPFFQAPLEFTNPGSSNANQWFGRTRVVSDTLGASAVVSTALVAADSIIFTTLQGQTAVKSYAAVPSFIVATISPGNFFKIEAVNSVAAVGSYTVGWVLFNPGG